MRDGEKTGGSGGIRAEFSSCAASGRLSGRDIELFALAGVATAPHFMERFCEALHNKLASEGATVRSATLFPYGDWSRKIAAQLREAGHDLRLRAERFDASIGGTRAVADIDGHRQEHSVPGRAETVLVGHSAGGMAAVHAASLLLAREGGAPCPVVMIGSPKCRIPPELRDSVLYMHALGREGGRRAAKPIDPIARIGTFGGWRRGKYRLPVWQLDKHGPSTTLGIPIVGGHADYFREREPHMNAFGQSNLVLMLDVVWTWLTTRLQLPGKHC